MRVLIACEESQAVCKEFRRLGHEAYSCDIQPCSGGHPEWHYQKDIFEVINMGWDMMIGHPPCTYISYAGNRWFNIDRYGDKAIERFKLKDQAIDFFKALWSAPIDKICLENPRGFIMKEIWYSQKIEPYYFGDSCTKTTLLWLKGLPNLYHNKNVNIFDNNVTHVYKGEMAKDGSGSEALCGLHTLKLSQKERSKLRSKTFPGIAKAMAEQWGGKLSTF